MGTDSAATISRREAIRRAALVAGVSITPGWLQAATQTQNAIAAGATGAASNLSAAHMAVLTAAAERILPRTDTPGATDVGVPAFLDRFYASVLSPTERTLLTDALDAIERAASSAHGSAFASLTASQQDAVLRTVATAQQDVTPSSFGTLRSLVVLGYFTSEEVGRNVLHYDPVPGAYDGCLPIEQVGRRNWTT